MKRVCYVVRFTRPDEKFRVTVRSAYVTVLAVVTGRYTIHAVVIYATSIATGGFYDTSYDNTEKHEKNGIRSAQAR